MRAVHVLNAALAIGLIWFSVSVYPELPERIPVHFAADGSADSWEERSLIAWLALPLIGLLTTAFLYVIAALLPKHPTWVNMPDKRRLLELPDNEQRWVVEVVSTGMYLVCTTMLASFALLQYSIWQTAHGQSNTVTFAAGLAFAMAGTPLVALWMVTAGQRRMNDAWRRQQDEAAPAV